MMDFQGSQTIRITCAPGLVSYLQYEVEELGYTQAELEQMETSGAVRAAQSLEER